MKRPPKVSVVMPAYNHARFVGAAIRSVLDQDFGDFELCIVDDASTDGTPDVVAVIRDGRIRFVRSPVNRGVSATLNAAIRMSSGEYIAVLNSDDAFLPGKLRAQVDLLERRTELGAAFGLPQFIDDDGNVLAPERTFYRDIFFVDNRDRADWLRHIFLRGNCLCHPSATIRRACHDAIGLYDERLAQVHDLDVWLRLLARFEIWVEQEPLLQFRIRSGGQNASAIRTDTETRTTWEEARVLRRYAALPDALFDRAFAAELERLRIARSAPRTHQLAELAFVRKTRASILLGLDLLYDAVGPDASAPGDGTSHGDFIRLTGRYDLYGIGLARRLSGQLEARTRQLQEAGLLPTSNA